MKFFVQILTFYFCVMAFTPSDVVMSSCCTPSTGANETCHTTSEDADTDKKDCCKDFCFCAFFGTMLTFTTEKKAPKSSIAIPFYIENNFSYKSITGLELSSSIWQPPRLS